MFAVIRTGGKQYLVKEGDVVDVEKLGIEAGKRILFEDVLLLDDGAQTMIGTPIVEGAVVLVEVLETFKDDKVLVFKKKRRKQFRRTRGHRQALTKVKVAKIYPDRKAVPADALTVEAPPLVPPPAPAPAPTPAAAAKPAPKAKTPAKKEAAKKPAKAKAEKPKTEKPKAKTAAKPKAAKAKK
jgi:large subunit ribosomal protein L21